jgi:hypothetical protein
LATVGSSATVRTMSPAINTSRPSNSVVPSRAR